MLLAGWNRNPVCSFNSSKSSERTEREKKKKKRKKKKEKKKEKKKKKKKKKKREKKRKKAEKKENIHQKKKRTERLTFPSPNRAEQNKKRWILANLASISYSPPPRRPIVGPLRSLAVLLALSLALRVSRNSLSESVLVFHVSAGWPALPQQHQMAQYGNPE